MSYGDRGRWSVSFSELNNHLNNAMDDNGTVAAEVKQKGERHDVKESVSCIYQRLQVHELVAV